MRLTSRAVCPWSRLHTLALSVVLLAAGTPGQAAQSAAATGLDCVIEPNVLVDVSSSEIGVLAAVHVEKAQTVTRGQLLAELDTEVERAALTLSRARAESKAELELLQQTLDFNTRRRQRNDELHAKRAVPEQVLDEARTEQDLARLRLQQAMENHNIARLELARDEHSLERRYIRSPIDGVVVARQKSAGEYVEGDPIVQLAQVDPLRVELVAPIDLIREVTPGMRATIRSELEPETPLAAMVTHIDPMVDAATGTFGIRLSLPNPRREIPPGLKCTVTLDPPAADGAESGVPTS